MASLFRLVRCTTNSSCQHQVHRMLTYLSSRHPLIRSLRAPHGDYSPMQEAYRARRRLRSFTSEVSDEATLSLTLSTKWARVCTYPRKKKCRALSHFHRQSLRKISKDRWEEVTTWPSWARQAWAMQGWNRRLIRVYCRKLKCFAKNLLGNTKGKERKVNEEIGKKEKAGSKLWF